MITLKELIRNLRKGIEINPDSKNFPVMVLSDEMDGYSTRGKSYPIEEVGAMEGQEEDGTPINFVYIKIPSQQKIKADIYLDANKDKTDETIN